MFAREFRTGRVWLISIIVCLAMTAILGGCSKPTTTSGANGQRTSSKPFKIALVTWPGYGPLFIAKEKGWLGGLDVQFKVIDDTAPRHAAFKSGDVDMIAETVDSFASGAPTYGMPVKAVYKTDDSNGADGLVVTKSINDIHQLKGKSVALPRGMPSHFLLLNLLKMNNMTSKDITILDMAPQAAGQAFGAGKVEAAVTWEPYVTDAAKKGGGKVLLNSQQMYGYIVDIMVVSDKVMNERPGDVQKIIDAHFKGLQYLREHPKESYEIIAKYLKPLTPADVEGMISLMDFSDPADNKMFFNPQTKFGFNTVFRMAGDAWVNEGIIDKALNAGDCATTKFVDAYDGPMFSAHQGPKTAKPVSQLSAANQKKVTTGKGMSSLSVPLHFTPGSADLQEEHYQKLRPVGEALMGYPAYYIRIEGHTANLGSRATNLVLSLKRAESVAKYIRGNFGISPGRVIVKGFGPDRPVASNATPAGCALNRRVEFVLVPASSAIE